MPHGNSHVKPVESGDRTKPRQMPRGVLVRGLVYDNSGYADETRGILFGLHRAGIPMQLEPVGSQDLTVGVLTIDEIEELELLKHQRVDFARGVLFQHLPAHDFNTAVHGRTRVGRTMFETDSIPDGWRAQCEAMDEIWVPTNFNAQVLAAAGVTAEKLHVLPSGVDTALFRPGLEPLRIAARRGFNFLSVFEWTSRKGPDILLRAYLSEFKPAEDVTLMLKTYSRTNRNSSLLAKIAYFVEREVGMRLEDTPPILLFAPGFLSTEDIPRLYSSADAFVLPSRGEGYGRPYMEALSCECPVVATRWSGQMDFLHDQNCELIEWDLTPVLWNTDIEVFAGHRWAEPRVEHLRRVMRHVFEHRDEARKKAVRGRQEMVQRWDWEVLIRDRWVPAFRRLLP
jgi:glycosyltransferase involved in cell wall biosynthesis